MTVLQDWLGIAPLTQRAVKSAMVAALRMGAPAAPPRRKPKAMRRGVERC
jgi:hypothetical protein